MYSLIRVWIGAKLARMLIQLRVVVRTTSASDRPSTPSLYWMPKIGIQCDLLDELEEPGRVPTRGSRARATSETTHVASAAASARTRAQRAGENADDDAPTSGRKTTAGSAGRSSSAAQRSGSTSRP